MDINVPAFTIRTPRLRAIIRLTGLTLAALVLALCSARDAAESAATNTTVPLVTSGDVGRFTSIELDGAGVPVISFSVAGVDASGTVRCGNPTCTPPPILASGADAISTSLALSANGFIWQSYFNSAQDDLGLLRCLEFDCSSRSYGSIDSGGLVGSDHSLELDAQGRPVVSYYDFTNGNLKIAHCQNIVLVCGAPTLTSPDTAGNVGPFTSLELDALGYPVVSYFDSSNSTLKVMHCNDPNCAGGDESIQSPEPASGAGTFTSLALDSGGRPVVSYFDSINGDLKVMHCNDVNCAGGGESIQSPDTVGFLGSYSSLALDTGGRPVISYYDSTNGDLKVMHCNDANCAGGGESTVSPDTAGTVGQYTSLALDAQGRPVVSYYDATNGDLKVLSCGTQTCNNNPAVQEIRATSLTTGWEPGPMGGVCYNIDPTDTGDPTFVVCDNETGSGVDTSPRCTKDTSAACTDDDPVLGSIAVAVLEGSYELTINGAPGHVPDTHVKSCNVSGGLDAKCSFNHTPLTRPWFPWDVNGDRSVSAPDIFQTIAHFNETK